MDPTFILVENFGRFAAIVGLLLATPAFAYAGWLWISSMGDPTRSAVARNSVISVCVGILVIGVAFLLPPIIMDTVVSPVGGIEYEMDAGLNCDQVLRNHLVLNREASNANRINFIIQQIQSRFEDCGEENWSPVARVSGSPIGDTCFGSSSRDSIAGVQVPTGLSERSKYELVNASGRDARNNVIVHWTTHVGSGKPPGLPSDSALCWMYVSALDTWVEGY